MKRLAVLATMALITGCGGGGAHSDERSAAVQAALDARPPVETVYAGFACLYNSLYEKGDPKRYEHIPGAHVGPVVKRPRFEGILQPSEIKPGGPTKSCREVTWDTSARVKQDSVHSTYGLATLGRYVLDKLGDDVHELGMTSAPFRAHFEPTPTGKALIDARIVPAPAQSEEGSMFMSKDADGHLKARTLGTSASRTGAVG